MLYKPPAGRFKDGHIFWHEGRYFLFAMYSKAPWPAEDYFNVWLATSGDGVHWADVGIVIEDAPWPILAMSVSRVGDRFIMNHGSDGRKDVQNILKFWESDDLLTWRYRGEEHDLRPDSRWYHPDSRLDCMDVLRVQAGGETTYYGYATGPGGFLRSEDGLDWTGVEPQEVDWDPFTPPPSIDDGLEIGGCQPINGRYYLLGGWFNYAGLPGYGVYTLVGDSPAGPFRPDPVFRLCGNSNRWVAMWARFCRTEHGPLINGYMYSGYSYETPDTWLPPLKEPVVDAAGHLRLHYWRGNEALKEDRRSLSPQKSVQVFPSARSVDARFSVNDDRLAVIAGPAVSAERSMAPADMATTIVLLDSRLDFDRGVLVEGVIEASCDDPRLATPTVGIYLEEGDGIGTAILFHGYGRTQIGKLTIGAKAVFESEDEIGAGCASAAGITPDEPHVFRLLARQNMFEVYLDDWLVQTFNTTHSPDRPGVTPRRLGFLARNGRLHVEGLQVWRMTLGPNAISQEHITGATVYRSGSAS